MLTVPLQSFRVDHLMVKLYEPSVFWPPADVAYQDTVHLPAMKGLVGRAETVLPSPESEAEVGTVIPSPMVN